MRTTHSEEAAIEVSATLTTVPRRGVLVSLSVVAFVAPVLALLSLAPASGDPVTAALLAAVAIASAATAVVGLRDLLVDRPEPTATSLHEALVEQAETRLAELSSPSAMLLMSAAVALTIVCTAIVAILPAPGFGALLPWLGVSISVMLLVNLVWAWWVEVPRLTQAVEALQAAQLNS